MKSGTKVDLHLHTTASDGTWHPEKLVAHLQQAGIGMFAVTDHDTTENLAETARLAKDYGIKLINGVEISTTYRRRIYHILGYGIDPLNSELQQLLATNRKLVEEEDDGGIRLLEKQNNMTTFLFPNTKGI